MSVTVKFATTSKKKNSTEVVSTYALSLSATLKEPTSVISPVLIIERTNNDIIGFNYMYIQEFSRYYFIDDIVSLNYGVWEISARVDVLASFKSQIGSQSLYVLRSSTQSNGRIIDTKYPAMVQANTYIDAITSWTLSAPNSTTPDYTATANIFNVLPENGYYYVGIFGKNTTGVTWYCMPYIGFLSLATGIYNFTPSDMSDVSSGIAKALANPVQWIAGVYWLPFRRPSHTPPFVLTQIYLGNYPIDDIQCAEVDPVKHMVKCTASVTLRKHPDASSRGAYLNSMPFSRYKLNIQPWGLIDLDSSLMINDATLTLNIWTDFSTGMAELSVYASNSCLAKMNTQLGVPINLTQAVVDYMGAGAGLSKAISNTIGLIGSAVTGNVSGLWSTASSAVGGFVSAAESMQPTVSTTGSTGSFLPFTNGEPQALYTDFYYPVSDANSIYGKPLCSVTTPATLGGYILADATGLSISATDTEVSQIQGYIENGFWYE